MTRLGSVDNERKPPPPKLGTESLLHPRADCFLQQFEIRIAEAVLKREHRGSGCKLLTARMQITEAQVELRVKILQDLNGALAHQLLHVLSPHRTCLPVDWSDASPHV
jgi:hypothetical protein